MTHDRALIISGLIAGVLSVIWFLFLALVYNPKFLIGIPVLLLAEFIYLRFDWWCD
jgi:hypothetical protein